MTFILNDCVEIEHRAVNLPFTVTAAAVEATPPEEKAYFLDLWGVGNVVDVSFHVLCYQ